ncbi:AraC family transcriptional regulator [Pedobacter sp. MR2016-19]|uniref:AraC family transcriptional regulator n=1 Tax=Pedobacter sp. MR2016-19 TaxID=2780089 RepID=UPI001876D7EC|nr:helix-turn-helix domain-containing protein [Pedobacter sp. MR2016-19]MBE5321431.1 AraC family transcriptional regulator [Pedobacter sp. MR2016-19]
MHIFETFKPESELIRKYVSYYYLHITDDQHEENEYICYPHYNNTISLYSSHRFKYEPDHATLEFNIESKPLQIYTPIRERPLKVTQTGAVCKIAIVFNPFGINQFLNGSSLLAFDENFSFFEEEEIKQLFGTSNIEKLVTLVDHLLIKRYAKVENLYIEKALDLFRDNVNDISIDSIAENKLGISRKHLNRLFHKYLNISPQKYRSIVRFRELMSNKLSSNSDQNLSDLSHRANYTDQSHFIKACKLLTGVAPAKFFNDGKIIGKEDTFWKFSS